MPKTILFNLPAYPPADQLAEALGNNGYNAVPAPEGQSLKSALRAHRPDLIILQAASPSRLMFQPDELGTLLKMNVEVLLLSNGVCMPASPGLSQQFIHEIPAASDLSKIAEKISGILNMKEKRGHRSHIEQLRAVMASAPEGMLEHWPGSMTPENLMERFRHAEEISRLPIDSLASLDEAEFHFRTLKEAENVAATIAHACPDPAMAGLGFSELMVNAIEHGNLGITHEEKTDLVLNGHWEREISRRLSLAENHEKFVRVHFRRTTGKIIVLIRDEGDGFDWRRFTGALDEATTKPHGRGIAVATMIAFDTVEFLGKGNEVSITINCQ